MHDNDEQIQYHQTEQADYDGKQMYVFVFDYDENNKIFRYDISNLKNDSEIVEAFLKGAGHKLKNCDWMVTKHKDFVNGN